MKTLGSWTVSCRANVGQARRKDPSDDKKDPTNSQSPWFGVDKSLIVDRHIKEYEKRYGKAQLFDSLFSSTHPVVNRYWQTRWLDYCVGTKSDTSDFRNDLKRKFYDFKGFFRPLKEQLKVGSLQELFRPDFRTSLNIDDIFLTMRRNHPNDQNS